MLSLGFTFGVDSISEEVVGFLLYVFPEENICVHCLLCLIDVLVILSDKILISYSLNVKNITKRHHVKSKGVMATNEQHGSCSISDHSHKNTKWIYVSTNFI